MASENPNWFDPRATMEQFTVARRAGLWHHKVVASVQPFANLGDAEKYCREARRHTGTIHAIFQGLKLIIEVK